MIVSSSPQRTGAVFESDHSHEIYSKDTSVTLDQVIRSSSHARLLRTPLNALFRSVTKRNWVGYLVLGGRWRRSMAPHMKQTLKRRSTSVDSKMMPLRMRLLMLLIRRRTSRWGVVMVAFASPAEDVEHVVGVADDSRDRSRLAMKVWEPSVVWTNRSNQRLMRNEIDRFNRMSASISRQACSHFLCGILSSSESKDASKTSAQWKGMPRTSLENQAKGRICSFHVFYSSRSMTCWPFFLNDIRACLLLRR